MASTFVASGWSTLAFATALLVALALSYRPVGDYLTWALTDARHRRPERWAYRAIGASPDGEQAWNVYARSVLAFSAVGVLALYLLQRVQDHLWLGLGLPPVPPDLAWNTAVSFVTNTNW